jgi:hypothetical protein
MRAIADERSGRVVFLSRCLLKRLELALALGAPSWGEGDPGPLRGLCAS